MTEHNSQDVLFLSSAVLSIFRTSLVPSESPLQSSRGLYLHVSPPSLHLLIQTELAVGWLMPTDQF